MPKFDYKLECLAPILAAQPKPQQPTAAPTSKAEPRPNQAQTEPAPAAEAVLEAQAEPQPDPETVPDIDPVTATTKPKTSSARRIAASRANGALSHGPTTPEGLARLAASPRNLKHGLLAQSVVLATESGARFDALLDELLTEYQPQTRSEYTLVEMMAIAMWRHRRALTIQKTDFDLEIARHQSTAPAPCTPPVAATVAHRSLHGNGHTYSTAIRYETTFERQYHRARRELRLLQKERLENPPLNAPAKPVADWKAWSLTFNNIFDETANENESEAQK